MNTRVSVNTDAITHNYVFIILDSFDSRLFGLLLVSTSNRISQCVKSTGFNTGDSDVMLGPHCAKSVIITPT